MYNTYIISHTLLTSCHSVAMHALSKDEMVVADVPVLTVLYLLEQEDDKLEEVLTGKQKHLKCP